MKSWEWPSNKFPSQIRRQLLAGEGTRRSLLNQIAGPALGVFSGILMASAAIGAESEKPADKVYDLAGLLNLALTRNPYTREAWQTAVAAAAEAGEARAPYYPKASFRMEGGVDQAYSVAAPGPTYYTRKLIAPGFLLEYLLVDFGRRRADVQRTLFALDSASLRYDRQLQRTIFGVQRSYFAHSAALEGEKSARVNLDLARTLFESIQEKMSAGLATEPEERLAERALAEAEYDLESARRSVKITLGELRTAAGVAANAPLQVEPLLLAAPNSLAALQAKLDELVDAALVNRPDLESRVADLRAREAATSRAKADFFPEIRFKGAYRNETFGYRDKEAKSHGTFSGGQNQFGAFLEVDWELFDGFERVEKVKQRLAEEETARAELEIQRLDTILDVWSSYYVVLTSLRRVQFAQAALSSSQENFDASQAFFEDGLATIPELVSAQNELAATRSERARAIADYLTAIASFTLAMGKSVTTASKESSSSKYPPAAPSVPPSTKPQKTPAHFSDGSGRAF
jgi:outer membrane protein